jgi:hypothetical protein
MITTQQIIGKIITPAVCEKENITVKNYNKNYNRNENTQLLIGKRITSADSEK